MMHLTYNRRNPIGDGCAEPANAGLSDFGRAVIAEMNKVGVIIDVAHSGWRTCQEAAEASARPIVSSHSACAALNHHHRCKPDDVMRAIADKGGTLGITNVPAFLGGSGCIDALLDHIDHAVQVVGVDHVTIGTDRAYVSCRAREENAKVRGRRGRPPALGGAVAGRRSRAAPRVGPGAHDPEPGVDELPALHRRPGAAGSCR